MSNTCIIMSDIDKFDFLVDIHVHYGIVGWVNKSMNHPYGHSWSEILSEYGLPECLKKELDNIKKLLDKHTNQAEREAYAIEERICPEFYRFLGKVSDYDHVMIMKESDCRR